MSQLTLEDVGLQLESLAAEPGANQLALRALADEIKSGGARLAGVDLLAAYPPELMIPRAGRASRFRLITVLATVRDLLVFAPIAITWWSLHEVLTAWSGAGYPGNLLQYWQDPPGGGISLSTAALAVVAVLLAVAALTLVAVLLDTGEEDVVDVRQRLTTQLTTASLLLAAPGTNGRQTARQLATVAGRLGNSTTTLAGAIDKIGADLHAVASAGPGTDLHDALQEWRRSAEALAKLGESLTAPAAMVEEFVKLRTSVEREEAALRQTIQQVAERLEESTAVAVREGLAHTRVAEDAREATQGLSVALDRFTERTQDLGTLVAQIRGLLIRLESTGLLVGEQRVPRGNADGPVRDGYRR
ncbi:hypothetical protein [Micromonospora parva]|uniref:hypothetical protein n=1 Tax=Micromonospora parva TaxID=1464048 RepID=UPI0034048DA3